jgi:hypothetical protein
MDEFLRQLAAQDPDLAAALREQDQRFADNEWHDRVKRLREERAAEHRAQHPELSEQQRDEIARQYGPILRAVARLMAREIEPIRQELDVVKEHLRREFKLVDALRRDLHARRGRRRKKLTQAEIKRRADAHVMRVKGLPPEAFEEKK